MQVIGLVYRPYQVVQTTETQVDTRVSGDTAVVYLVCQMEMNYCSRGYPNSQSVLISPTSLPPHTHTHTHTPTHPHTGVEYSTQPAGIQCAHPPLSVGGDPGSAHRVARIHTPCIGPIHHHWICYCVSCSV